MRIFDYVDALEGKKEGHEYRARCPVHGGMSLSITGKGGKILIVCRAGCLQWEVIQALKTMGLWEGGSGYKPSPPEPESQNAVEKRIEKADRMWQESAPITTGDPVWLYLKNRGINLEAWPEDLRTHPALPYWTIDEAGKPVKTGVFPCLLTVVRSPQGKPVGIHRTWISPDGSRKASVPSSKKLYKIHNLSGSSSRLFPVSDNTLAIAEGIETALSVYMLYGEACWSCISAHGMASFIPPEGVSTVRIYADHDENETGLKAALKSYDRLTKEGRTVEIRQPREIGDYNDELIKKPGLACWPDRAREQ